jgi:hypothetical protein
MSPVSRPRKAKTKHTDAHRPGNPANRLPTQRGGGDGPEPWRGPENPFGAESPLSALARSLGVQHTKPVWVPAVATAVLDRADVLTQAQSPRALEDMTAHLLGEHLHRMAAEHEQIAIDWLLEDILDLAQERIRAQLAMDDPTARAGLRLLHGLRAIGGPALARAAGDRLKALRPSMRGSSAALDAEWLADAAKLRMTGEVWTLRDVYGARIGVIARTEYPGRRDRAVYLFDIDACGFVCLAGGGAFDDPDQAANAWRSAVGWAAEGAVLAPLAETGTEVLRCLTETEFSEEIVLGDESRAVWDEWLRCMRRISDLAAALQRTGRSLPAHRSLYHDYDPGPLTAEFSAHLVTLGGGRPLDATQRQAVDALVGEWLEGMLPDTCHAVSPHRLQHQLALIADWFDDEMTATVKALLPDWVSFLAQRAGISKDAAEAALSSLATLQAGGTRENTHCPCLL